jgi:hypothetical protein
MKRIISLLVIVAVMTAGVPLSFAADGKISAPPPEGVVQQDNPADPVDVRKRGPNYTGLAVGVGIGLLALIAIAASGSDGTTTPSDHP